jgi:NADH-quinone oxidoreductase subunit L
MSPLFELSDTALSVVMVIGAITALFMGFLGVVQNDIKRVIAYSTLSQLGYMTVALGVSAYPAALFHLMTHAFFKALLFLAAGSVIIGLHHEQDMRKMGGLYKWMPITWATSLLGSLALIGTPFFSGFYSKDSIIEAVSASSLPGAGFAYFAVMASVFVTALYSFRLVFLVFHGKPRFHGEPHESPWVVTVPLILLAIPAVIIGAVAIKPMLYGDFFAHGIAFDTVIFVSKNHPAMLALHEAWHHEGGWLGMALHAFQAWTSWLALAGVVTAWVAYLRYPGLPARIRQRCLGIHALLSHHYYLDNFNDRFFARGAIKLGSMFWRIGDLALIDGLVNGVGRWTAQIGAKVRAWQSGYLYQYAFVMMSGLLILVTFFVFFAPMGN